LALVRVGRLTDAKIHFDVAVRLRPEHVELHYNIGDWWWRSGDPARAAEEFAHALKLNPDFKPALQRLQSLRLSR
jgi:tetratricopeptide (TPR) repeat protein